MQTHCYIVYWIYSKINLNLNLNLTTARVQYRAQFVLHCLKGSSDTVYLPGEIQSIQWHVAKTANANHACHLLRDIVTQGVALKRRNRTGPPWSVNRPTVHAPGGRPAGPLASSVKPGPHQQQCRSNVRLCCQKRQQCRTSFALKFRPFDKVERCFDIVATVDRVLQTIDDDDDRR